MPFHDLDIKKYCLNKLLDSFYFSKKCVSFPDMLREEDEQKYLGQMEEMSKGHHQQLMAARMELDRAMELAKQKVWGDGVHLKMGVLISNLRLFVRNRYCLLPWKK